MIRPDSALDTGRPVASTPDFDAGDRVWVEKLNKMGVVQATRRSQRGEVEYYLLKVGAGSGTLRMIVSPSAVAKWLKPQGT